MSASIWNPATGDTPDAVANYTNLRTYGAEGNGTTDDSEAFEAAIAAGRNVRGVVGDTYLLNSQNCNVPNQVFELWGCTLKLKSGATNALLRFTAADIVIIGATIDCNGLSQQGIVVSANGCKLLHCNFINFTGANIGAAYLTNNAGSTTISHCKFNSTQSAATVTYAVYGDALTADAYNNRVEHCEIDVSANPRALGIYLSGSADAVSFFQRKASIVHNTVKGTAAVSGQPVGITYRGVDGNVSHNHTEGFYIGVSGDISQDSRYTDNKVKGTNGATSIGLEVNGKKNVLANNQILGSARAISLSVDGATQPSTPDLIENEITGNLIDNPTQYGIYINASGGKVGQDNLISGNKIRFTTVATNRIAIYLQTAVTDTMISGNKLAGPGVGQAGGSGIFMDTAAFDTTIMGNKISGFERPARIYAGTAVTFTGIKMKDNDLSIDCPTQTNSLVISGSAAFGANCQLVGNIHAGNDRYDVLDMRTTVMLVNATGTGTPEGNVVAGPGSFYQNKSGGAGTTLYEKRANTTNLGWFGI